MSLPRVALPLVVTVILLGPGARPIRAQERGEFDSLETLLEDP
jgi:hypothetical protein